MTGSVFGYNLVIAHPVKMHITASLQMIEGETKLDFNQIILFISYQWIAEFTNFNKSIDQWEDYINTRIHL